MSQTLNYGFAGEMQYEPYYCHSGKVTTLGIIAGVAAGIASAIVLSFAYAYADSYIPIIYANIFLAIGFGAGVGFATSAAMRWGKVRNAPLTLAVTAIVTLLAFYLCWAIWICVTLDRYASTHRPFGMLGLILDPREIVDLMRLLNESGTWSIGHGSSSGNQNVSGLFLWLIWLCEAVAIIGTSLLVAKTSDRPFCERCQTWSPDPTPIAPLAAGDISEVRLAMQNRDWGPLGDAALAPIDEGNHWTLAHSRCPTCDEMHLLTLGSVKTTIDRKGKPTTAKATLVRNLRISPADLAVLREQVAPSPTPTAVPVADVASAEPAASMEEGASDDNGETKSADPYAR